MVRLSFLNVLQDTYTAHNRYQYERDDSEKATPFLTLAETICKEHEEDLPHQRSRLYGIQFRVTTLTNEIDKCFDHASSRMDLEERTYYANKEMTVNLADTHDDLGIAQSMKQQYQEAIPLFLQSIQIRENTSGFHKTWLFTPLYHLGLASWYRGNYFVAAKKFKEALQDQKDTYGFHDTVSVRCVFFDGAVSLLLNITGQGCFGMPLEMFKLVKRNST